MKFCNSHGIPHSVFLSWDSEDQSKALAYERYQASLCSGCKTRREEWEEDRFAYITDVIRCPACELIEQENDNIRMAVEESKDNSMTYGLKILLKKNSPDLVTSGQEIFG